MAPPPPPLCVAPPLSPETESRKQVTSERLKVKTNKYEFGSELKNQITLLFSLFLLLFMSYIVIFDTIHESY